MSTSCDRACVPSRSKEAALQLSAVLELCQALATVFVVAGRHAVRLCLAVLLRNVASVYCETKPARHWSVIFAAV